MKILKRLLFVVIAIIGVIFAIALFTKRDYTVQKEITINKPVDYVFDYVKHLKNMENYSAWSDLDPNMKHTYKGTDGEVGFISAWESDNKDVGVGEQEITTIIPNRKMEFSLRFFKPYESEDEGYIATEAVTENKTKVIWGFDGHMDYPMNAMMLFMDFEEMIGESFDQSLERLKTVLEEDQLADN